MLEKLMARVKVMALFALFMSPVAVSTWSMQTSAWLSQNHRFDALPGAAQVVAQVDIGDEMP